MSGAPDGAARRLRRARPPLPARPPALPGLVAAYLLRVPRPRLVREPGEEAAGALLRTVPARAFAAARAG